MSRWLALADGTAINTQTPPDTLTKPDKTPETQPQDAFCRVLSVCQVEGQEKPTAPNTNDMSHGFAINGHPKTWTGKIVSLDAWRELSEWDKHGPDGRMWCGACKGWSKHCEHIGASSVTPE
jgi:hypothetical protein